MTDAEQKKVIFESTLRRQEMHWNALSLEVRHSDRAAVDTGLEALKTAILINAGAIVALLAFAGQLWNKDHGREAAWQVLSSGKSFATGVVYGVLSFTIAYFYQSIVTGILQRELDQVSEGAENLKPSPWLHRLAIITMVPMIVLALCSAGSFVCGVSSVTDALKAVAVDVTEPVKSETAATQMPKAETPNKPKQAKKSAK